MTAEHDTAAVAARDTSRNESPSSAERAPGAPASAAGTAAAFGPGSPVSPRSLRALQALAGNRAVQRRLAPLAAAVQRRRVPGGTDVHPLVAHGAVDRDQHVAGLERVNQRALSQATPAQRAAMLAEAHLRAGSRAAFEALPRAERATILAGAIRFVDPRLVLGDPALINIGPRPGTRDAANIATLVNNTVRLINFAISSAHDLDLRDVFGENHVATARRRYANARDHLPVLAAQNRIVTDRSGYGQEVDQGGLANRERIAIMASAIDNPHAARSMILLIHEAMHAGNPGVVGDGGGYPHQPGFRTQPEEVKIANAAHYEVVPSRIHALPDDHFYGPFRPAGSARTENGVTHREPSRTPLQQATATAAQLVRDAWNSGLNLHNHWLRIHRNRADWTGVDLPSTIRGATARRYADCMPYWSRVQGLTVHERPGFPTATVDPSAAPVTRIDLALSEGLTRLLVLMKYQADRLRSDAATGAFLAAHVSAAERSAATTAAQLTALLLAALRRAVGPLTGDEARDLRVVRTMAAAGPTSVMFAPRTPAAFA